MLVMFSCIELIGRVGIQAARHNPDKDSIPFNNDSPYVDNPSPSDFLQFAAKRHQLTLDMNPHPQPLEQVDDPCDLENDDLDVVGLRSALARSPQAQEASRTQQVTQQNSMKNPITQTQSFSLKGFNPSATTGKLSSFIKKKKNYNYREAIQKSDLTRIRSGSPGSRNGKVVALPKKEETFEHEMVNHGIIEDLQEVGRFNYVLLSRSVEFDQCDESQLNSLCQNSQQ